mmetsp:Transcript_23979/g.72028  ORF Transcript_23979/g.72028 Transcript_23979/m.72028 type:complete len:214 (-) Transcript_23979:3414-4055(-)
MDSGKSARSSRSGCPMAVSGGSLTLRVTSTDPRSMPRVRANDPSSPVNCMSASVTVPSMFRPEGMKTWRLPAFAAPAPKPGAASRSTTMSPGEPYESWNVALVLGKLMGHALQAMSRTVASADTWPTIQHAASCRSNGGTSPYVSMATSRVPESRRRRREPEAAPHTVGAPALPTAGAANVLSFQVCLTSIKKLTFMLHPSPHTSPKPTSASM